MGIMIMIMMMMATMMMLMMGEVVIPFVYQHIKIYIFSMF